MVGKVIASGIKVYIFELVPAIFLSLQKFTIRKMTAVKVAVEDFGAFLAKIAIRKMTTAKVAVENSMAFLERAAFEPRVGARVAVGFFGICFSAAGFIALFSSIFLSAYRPWHNILYIFTFLAGALIFQFAREDFDKD